MVVEAVLAPELRRAATGGTLERPHFQVLAKHVRVHVLLVRICCAAFFAKVRLFTWNRRKVGTDLLSKYAAGTRVRADVAHEVALHLERLETVAALVGRLHGVDAAHVLLQCRLLLRPVVTVGALERLLHHQLLVAHQQRHGHVRAADDLRQPCRLPTHICLLDITHYAHQTLAVAVAVQEVGAASLGQRRRQAQGDRGNLFLVDRATFAGRGHLVKVGRAGRQQATLLHDEP